MDYRYFAMKIVYRCRYLICIYNNEGKIELYLILTVY